MGLKVWVEYGLPYVDEEALNLYKCGCGAKPIFDFSFDYEKCEFICAQVKCIKCGMTTGLHTDLNKAIETWQNAFYINHYHEEFCRFCDADDISLGGFHND